ncbi:MAG TPA: hypothetical protein PK231_04720 [Acidocella sp.]|nr:hypothetical protein [Acidocella sp.]
MNVEEKPYTVRQSFTLHKGDAIFHGGDVVMLSEAEAHDRRHQIEPVAIPVEPAAGDTEKVVEKPAAAPKKKLFARK